MEQLRRPSASLRCTGDDVATGTTTVANFDRLGVQVTLAGAK